MNKLTKSFLAAALTVGISAGVGLGAGFGIKATLDEDKVDSATNIQLANEEVENYSNKLSNYLSKYYGMMTVSYHDYFEDIINNMEYASSETKEALSQSLDQIYYGYTSSIQTLLSTSRNNYKYSDYTADSIKRVPEFADKKMEPMSGLLLYLAEYDTQDSSLNNEQNAYYYFCKESRAKNLANYIAEGNYSEADERFDIIEQMATYSSAIDDNLSNKYSIKAGTADENVYSEMYNNSVTIFNTKTALDTVDYSVFSDEISSNLQKTYYLKGLDSEKILDKDTSYDVISAGIDEIDSLIESGTETLNELKQGKSTDTTQLVDIEVEVENKIGDLKTVYDGLKNQDNISQKSENIISSTTNKASELLDAIKDYCKENSITFDEETINNSITKIIGSSSEDKVKEIKEFIAKHGITVDEKIIEDAVESSNGENAPSLQ